MTKLVILDRDGVINEDSDNYIRSAREWIEIPGSIEAIARLSLAGYKVVVATNQSGLARGFFTDETLDAMHTKLLNLVQAQGGKIDGIYVCPHGPKDDCRCRKPRTGLIEQIFSRFDAHRSDTWLVGDSLRDLQAGIDSGCKAALVLTGKGRKTRDKLTESCTDIKDVPVYNNLNCFVEALLSEGI